MAERLVAWGLGAFHALFLLLAFVTAGYVLGGAGFGGALANVGTFGGLALGAWLLVVSVAATAWALRDAADLRAPALRPLVAAGVAAGGFAGSAFVAGAIVGIGVVTGEMPWVFLAFGTVFAFPAGSLVAAALALVDMGLYALAERSLMASSA